MNRQIIDIKKLNMNPVPLWKEQWFLLCAGDFKAGDFNAMTVAWGSFGVMWNKPFAQVVVRPGRYTYEFMEKYPDFTLSALPDSKKKALNLMGSKSGRDMDKIGAAGLTPFPSTRVGAPAFEEAELILECKTMYRNEMNPENFIDETIDGNYFRKDYHIIYYGEILAVSGISDYEA
jgi:flavin reductase (DIM6/NTAB) family NADH-FMN oxidoreductase RutF